MENKQLDNKDLLMNKKEELIWKVIDNVISCCTVTRIDGAKSITREDVVGKSREECSGKSSLTMPSTGRL